MQRHVPAGLSCNGICTCVVRMSQIGSRSRPEDKPRIIVCMFVCACVRVLNDLSSVFVDAFCH